MIADFRNSFGTTNLRMSTSIKIWNEKEREKMPVTRRSGTYDNADESPRPDKEEEEPGILHARIIQLMRICISVKATPLQHNKLIVTYISSFIGFDRTLRYTSLLCLTLQNALLILTMRYVRIRKRDMFLASTAVIMSEILKTVASLFIILIQEGSVLKFLKHMSDNIFYQPMDCIKVSVPALIYTLQNNLLYLAVSNLDAATFQVTYQLKILTTALFSVLMLKKSLSRLQWISLVILFLGVSIVQLHSDNIEAINVPVEQNPLIGLSAVLVSSLMSGFAGVYFEKILKGTDQTVWLRNVQLGFLGVVIGYITMEIKDGDKVRQQGFLFGYDSVVWIVVILQSYGGLMVAIVVKYADNILKGFAASASIIISCIASIIFFDFHLSLQFIIGVGFVSLSIYMYHRFEHKKPETLPCSI